VSIIDTRTPDPKRFIEGSTGAWEIIIGMEVHAQVTSESKLFSGSSTKFGNPPNANVSFVDAAMPGMLPVINAECVRQAVRTGLGLKAAINTRSIFDRKNYFYPDLPQGYQISQFKDPIVGEGIGIPRHVDGERIEIGIERLHLEQDAGKSIHDQHPNMSFVDLNRSGVALMEIVSQARPAFVRRSQGLSRRSCAPSCAISAPATATWSRARMRADINVSVRRPGGDSARAARSRTSTPCASPAQAIEYEARRQIDILEAGGAIDQETRLYDPKTGETRSMRIQGRSARLSLLPRPRPAAARIRRCLHRHAGRGPARTAGRKGGRFVGDYGVTTYDAMVLTLEKRIGGFFEAGRQGPSATASSPPTG
jgi:aspartyl-tRNA(Asn)/glutamyl-tRNA(Gln) amidotransferase subunit B